MHNNLNVYFVRIPIAILLLWCFPMKNNISNIPRSDLLFAACVTATEKYSSLYVCHTLQQHTPHIHTLHKHIHIHIHIHIHTQKERKQHYTSSVRDPTGIGTTTWFYTRATQILQFLTPLSASGRRLSLPQAFPNSNEGTPGGSTSWLVLGAVQTRQASTYGLNFATSCLNFATSARTPSLAEVAKVNTKL